MLKLRKLRIALAVGNAGTVVGAASELGLSQPAVSRALQSLEQDIGVQLFLRSSAGATLTAAGLALMARFRRALGQLEQAEIALRLAGVLRGQATDHEFRALIGVNETGSLAGAAQRDGLTPAAIAKSLRLLENRVGTSLALRTPQGMRLSAAGEAVYRRAKLAFAEIAHALDDVAALADVAGGRLRIGALPLTRPRLVPAMVDAVLNRFPAAEIAIFDGTYAALLSSLRQGDIDLIVGTIRSPGPVADTRSQVLFEDELAVVVRPGHRLVRQQGLTLEHCLSEDWVLPFKDVPLRMQFEAALTGRGLQRAGRALETDSLIVLRSLLLRGNRLAVVSRHQVLEEVRLGHLTILPLRFAERRRIGLTHLDTLLPTALIAAAIEELRSASLRLSRD